MAIDDSLLRGRQGVKSRLPSPGDIEGRLRHDGADAGSSAGHGSPPQAGPEAFNPESGDYKAYGWGENKPLPSLRFILKDRSERAFQYAHLDSHHPDGCQFIPSAPGRGNVIKLRFAGHSGTILVMIEGLRLRRLWELIMSHQTPWIHELPADVNFHGDSDEPVVKSLTFETVKD
jgi:hypothetical protein